MMQSQAFRDRMGKGFVMGAGQGKKSSWLLRTALFGSEKLRAQLCHCELPSGQMRLAGQ
jgi:hypothetical protein